MILRALAVVCVTMLASSAGAENALGRLFFTPEKRAALERNRAVKAPQAQQIEDTTLSLDGVVRRSDGVGTAWINGRAHHVGEPRHGVAIGLHADATGATVSVGAQAPSRLRVGETVNRGTGDLRRGLGNGEAGAQRAGKP